MVSDEWDLRGSVGQSSRNEWYGAVDGFLKQNIFPPNSFFIELYWLTTEYGDLLKVIKMMSSNSLFPLFSKIGRGNGQGVVEISNDMMTSSNGNLFRVTGPLCREFTGHRWNPLTKASDAELSCFLWSTPELTVELTREWWSKTSLHPLSRHGNGWLWR